MEVQSAVSVTMSLMDERSVSGIVASFSATVCCCSVFCTDETRHALTFSFSHIIGTHLITWLSFKIKILTFSFSHKNYNRYTSNNMVEL